MMICSIFNNDVKEFGALMMFPSKKVAKASFLNWLESQENKHFDVFDFELWYLADFDIKKGEIKVKKDKEKLTSGEDVEEKS